MGIGCARPGSVNFLASHSGGSQRGMIKREISGNVRREKCDLTRTVTFNNGL